MMFQQEDELKNNYDSFYDSFINQNNNNNNNHNNNNNNNTVLAITADYTIEAFTYSSMKSAYLTNFIYPFWKKEFLADSAEAFSDFNPFATWTPAEITRHNMGCKDNTLCVQMLVCDIPVAFCSVLLLDVFDTTDKLSPFSHAIYANSALLYNFVVDAPFRGQGYGARLLQCVLAHLRQRHTSYEFVTLYVQKDNAAAIKLYTKFNFVCRGDNPRDPLQQHIYALALNANSSSNCNFGSFMSHEKHDDVDNDANDVDKDNCAAADTLAP